MYRREAHAALIRNLLGFRIKAAFLFSGSKKGVPMSAFETKMSQWLHDQLAVEKNPRRRQILQKEIGHGTKEFLRTIWYPAVGNFNHCMRNGKFGITQPISLSGSGLYARRNQRLHRNPWLPVSCQRHRIMAIQGFMQETGVPCIG